jgi:pyruvate/2-oxoglutarate dehydrogenase complex dihydrolipoamide dehydrogenase (E3) component
MLPAMFLLVYIGAATRDALASDTADFYQQLFKYFGLAATVALLIVLTRLARKALREAEQIEEGSAVTGKPRLDVNYKPARFTGMVISGDPHDERLVDNCRALGRRNPAPIAKYNLVVIGGGTAGLVSAAGAAGLGAKVALIERNLLGGDCLNVGCVPSKGIIRAARAAHEARAGGEFGVKLSGASEMNFAAAMERMRRLRADLSAHDSVRRFTDLGVDVFIGEGRFVDPSTMDVEGTILQFHRAVITSGARPTEPAIAGLRETGFYTNETIFTLTELPRRLAVIGAGPIGCEMAQCFQRFGSMVTMITDGAEILPREDPDAATVVRRAMERDGVRIITHANVQRTEGKSGTKLLRLALGDRRLEVESDAILVCVGRTPNLENLGLDEAGVRYTVRGIDVDAKLRTTNPRIFAAGDVCSRYKFTHAADAMARIVIANALFMGRRKVTDLVIPWCTFTDPEIAHVGYYDRDAQAAGFRVATITQELRQVDRAVLDGQTDGFARVHYDMNSGRILGGTIVARHAGEMIGELTVAIDAEQKIGVLASTIHPYPTQAEALRKIGDAYMRTKLTPAVKKLFGKWLAWRRR